MKKIFALLCAFALLMGANSTAFAANGSVRYSGNSGQFIFAPGSEYSPTDLFDNYKSVMPGDTLNQRITVKNEANKKVKVKVYMRALGAYPDTEEFLSQLRLRITKGTGNKMAYMFDAPANETVGLDDWVYLGTLYSGGTVSLDLLLTVPTILGDEYQANVGYLEWEFMVKEYPRSPGDPVPPTGDASRPWLWGGIAVFSGVCFMAILFAKRKKRELTFE